MRVRARVILSSPVMPQPRVVLSDLQGQYEFRGGVAPGEYDVEVIRALNAAVSR